MVHSVSSSFFSFASAVSCWYSSASSLCRRIWLRSFLIVLTRSTRRRNSSLSSSIACCAASYCSRSSALPLLVSIMSAYCLGVFCAIDSTSPWNTRKFFARTLTPIASSTPL